MLVCSHLTFIYFICFVFVSSRVSLLFSSLSLHHHNSIFICFCLLSPSSPTLACLLLHVCSHLLPSSLHAPTCLLSPAFIVIAFSHLFVLIYFCHHCLLPLASSHLASAIVTCSCLYALAYFYHHCLLSLACFHLVSPSSSSFTCMLSPSLHF